jgi:hypothetical protein
MADVLEAQPVPAVRRHDADGWSLRPRRATIAGRRAAVNAHFHAGLRVQRTAIALTPAPAALH